MKESSENRTEVNLDEIIEKVGTFGKYQIITYILLTFPFVFNSAHFTNYVFTASDTEYRCKTICDVEKLEFEPHWLENAVPVRQSEEKCLIFKSNKNENDFLERIENSSCSFEWFNRDEKKYCNEYVYKYDNTFVEEMKIPCENWKIALVGTLHSIGTFINSPIIGYISDRYGRRIVIFASSFFGGILGVIKGFSVNYEMFVIFELLEATVISGIYTSVYILSLEILVPSSRVLGSTYINILNGLGQALLGLLAWIFPHWRTLIFIIYVPMIFFAVFYYYVLESFRWLYSKGKYQEVIDTFKKIAKLNGRDLPDDIFKPLFSVIESNGNVEPKTNKIMSSYRGIFKSKFVMILVLKCSFLWLTCVFCHYGLSLNAVYLEGNPYLNFIYVSLMEVPAHIIAYFVLDRIGRKQTLFITFMLSAICMFSFAFVTNDLLWLSLLLYYVGKLFIVLAFDVVYLYTLELFPTTIRHSLLAFCSMFGRIGSILTPFTPILSVYMKDLPVILFGSTCVISALIVLTSPETVNMKLPDTIEDMEGVHKSNTRQ